MWIRFLFLSLVLASPAWAAPKRNSKPAPNQRNSMFYYPHLLPSPFTLPAGRLSYGTEVALGLTSFLEVGTNVLRDAFQYYNARAKFSLFESPSAAGALTGSFETFNTSDVGLSNESVQLTSWMPGGIVALALGDRMAWFNGGSVNLSESSAPSDLKKAGFVRGSQVESDLAWGYPTGGSSDGESSASSSPITRAFSVGASYDFTYKVVGFGLSHHWPGFQLGAHYYPSATRTKVMPIIAGGGSLQF